MKTFKYLTLLILGCLSLVSNSYCQQPYKINPANGLPYLDASNNPIRNDKNFLPIPVFLNDFNSETNTKADFQYGSNLQASELSYIVLEDMNEDNCNDNCIHPTPIGPVTANTCNNAGFFNSSLLLYPIGHTYQLNSSVSTVKLIMKKYNQDFIRGWYKDGSCNWVRLDKKFSYTKGDLISRDAFKYGYFEARFKVNRPPGVSNKGLGQNFWLYPIKNPRNIDIEVHNIHQYCYSEIEIAEDQPHHGIHGFGAIVSESDVNCPTGNIIGFGTSECECNFFGKACADQKAALFHKRNIVQDEFHTYALEWTTSSLKYFYDNVLITTINNIGPYGKTPMNLDPMGIIFDIEGGNEDFKYHGRCSNIDNDSTIFPFEFEIDYVKLFKLDLSECNLVLPRIKNQTTFDLFANSPKVRLEISIGEIGFNYPIIINNGMNVSLRASSIIELNEGFVVESDAEFFADVIGGCDEGF